MRVERPAGRTDTLRDMRNANDNTERHNGSIAACEIVAARKRPQAIIRTTISYERRFETPFQIGYREQMEAFADRFGIVSAR
jgi:hypothetical protein